MSIEIRAPFLRQPSITPQTLSIRRGTRVDFVFYPESQVQCKVTFEKPTGNVIRPGNISEEKNNRIVQKKILGDYGEILYKVLCSVEIAPAPRAEGRIVVRQ